MSVTLPEQQNPQNLGAWYITSDSLFGSPCNGLVSVSEMLQSEHFLFIHKGCHEKDIPVYTVNFCIREGKVWIV